MQNTYSVKFSKKFNYPYKDLIKIIKEPGNLNNFHPFCKKNTPINWPNDPASDELVYLNNKTFVREINHWYENGYDLTITRNHISATVQWRVFSKKNGAALEITIYPCFLNNGDFLNFLSFYLYIRPKLRSYLKSIFKGLDFYLHNNISVRPNQFGRHTWFS